LIRLIDGLPDNVIGFEAIGEVTADDYKSAIDPAVDSALESHDDVRFLYVLGDEFRGYSGGAMWEDAKVGFSHWSKWTRIALVTDNEAYRDGFKAFAWMIPCDTKAFSLAERDDAETWIGG
jgi:hypothetical protein